MDEDAFPSPSDPRRTRRDILLDRLARMLEDMHEAGVTGPVAFEDLVRERGRPAPPTR